MKAFKDDVYDEADAMGYAQAVALNKQLEDKGWLSKAKRAGRRRCSNTRGARRVRGAGAEDREAKTGQGGQTEKPQGGGV